MSYEQILAMNPDVIIIPTNNMASGQPGFTAAEISADEHLAEVKAVKNGNAWCTTESMFQQTDKMGTIIQEMNKIFTGQSNGSDLNYIFRLE